MGIKSFFLVTRKELTKNNYLHFSFACLSRARFSVEPATEGAPSKCSLLTLQLFCKVVSFEYGCNPLKTPLKEFIVHNILQRLVFCSVSPKVSISSTMMMLYHDRVTDFPISQYLLRLDTSMVAHKFRNSFNSKRVIRIINQCHWSDKYFQ